MNRMCHFFFLIGSIGLFLVACNKPQDDPNDPNNTAFCSTNSGSFELTLGATTHTLLLDSQTHFTILYNWYSDESNHFILMGTDASGKILDVEGGLPGVFTTGTHAFDSTDLDFDFFDISLDTSSYYTSHLDLVITQSDFNSQDGTYTPIKGTFSGTAHSYPWTSGQPPIDSHPYEGEFCLNGMILP